MRVLLVSPTEDALPRGIHELLRAQGWEVLTSPDYAHAAQSAALEEVDALVVAEPAELEAGDLTALHALINTVSGRHLAGVWLRPGRPSGPTGVSRASLLEAIPGDTSLDELRGRLATIERYHTFVRGLERELSRMESFGKRLNQHFAELDQEFRLAARLQRDFLPKIGEAIRNAKFAALYRPASWVSGDIFDVFRVDDRRTAFYVADVVGHGLAAGLLTMFVKRVMSPGAAADHMDYADPARVLACLNEALIGQALPTCQFITACYGVLDHEILEIRLARAGHPYPLLIRRGGRVTEVVSAGGLIGVSSHECYEIVQVSAQPGDKLILHTDGIEMYFQGRHSPGGQFDRHNYLQVFESLADKSIDGLIGELDALVCAEKDSLPAADDVAIVGLEILTDSTSAKPGKPANSGLQNQTGPRKRLPGSRHGEVPTG